MDVLFIRILNMNLGASYVIVAVMVLRLLLKKAPKSLTCPLWLVVMVRLLVPFSMESAVSLVPVKSQPIPQDIAYMPMPVIDSGVRFIDQAVNPVLSVAVPADSTNLMQNWLHIGEIIWAAGVLLLLGGSLISLAVLLRRLCDAEYISQNIYSAAGLETAFVVGIIRPRIYLPEALKEEEREYILCHEQMHIKRKDHILRLFGFLALCVHWFNPLVWAAFLLLIRDMEMACDEAVLKKMGPDSVSLKKAYSASLLSLATGRRSIGGAPLAFGEGEVRGRVKNVLNYKKPGFWIILSVLLIVAVTAVCLLTSPAGDGGQKRDGILGQMEGVSQGDGITLVPLKNSDMASFSEAAQYWYQGIGTDYINGNYHLYPLEADYLGKEEEGYLVSYAAGNDRNTYLDLTAKKRNSMLEIGVAGQEGMKDSEVTGRALAAVLFPKGAFTAEQILVGAEEATDKIATEDMVKVTIGRADWSALSEASEGNLSAETIEKLNKMFSAEIQAENNAFSIDRNPNGLHCLIRTFFEEPKQLDFSEFMYHFPIGATFTDDERKALPTLEGWIHPGQTAEEIPEPVHKYKAEDIDKVLDYYLGITLDDLPEESKNQLLYSEQYDSYYNFTSDYGPGKFTIISGNKDGDRVVLYGDGYDYAGESLQNTAAILTLKEKDGRYLLESFLPQ